MILRPLSESVEAHLLHPHAWVRLASSRLFGLLFSAWKPEELVTGYQAKKRVYLQEDLPDKVRCCSKLKSSHAWRSIFKEVEFSKILLVW